MKVNKIFSIDHELAHKLKLQGYQSQTVNKLLIDYFGGSTTLSVAESELENKKALINTTKSEIEQIKENLVKLKQKAQLDKVRYV